jgi:hypothetical protein
MSLQSQPSVDPRRPRTSDKGSAQRHSISSASQNRISPRIESWPDLLAAAIALQAIMTARFAPPGTATSCVQEQSCSTSALATRNSIRYNFTAPAAVSGA